MKNGLVLGPCGPRSIRMRPTLVFEKRHAQETLHLLEKVMTEYSSWDDHVTKNPRKIKIWLPKFQPLPKSIRRSACYCRIWQLYLNKITAIRNKIPLKKLILIRKCNFLCFTMISFDKITNEIATATSFNDFFLPK